MQIWEHFTPLYIDNHFKNLFVLGLYVLYHKGPLYSHYF
jgi:hypothetical protein